MIQELIDNYVTISVTVLSILVLLQLVKRATARVLNVPGLVWWFAAWSLGACAALVVPSECTEAGWRCFAEQAIQYGGLALIMYPLTKRIVNQIRKHVRIGPTPKNEQT